MDNYNPRIKADSEHSIFFGDALDLLALRYVGSEDNVLFEGTPSWTKSSPRENCAWLNISRAQRIEAFKTAGSEKPLHYCPRFNCTHRGCTWNKKHDTGAKQTFSPMVSGGILLPDHPKFGAYGSGITVIHGEFGAGKSTLAFQMAAAAVDAPNHRSAAFISFDQGYCEKTVNSVLSNAEENAVRIGDQCHSNTKAIVRVRRAVDGSDTCEVVDPAACAEDTLTSMNSFPAFIRTVDNLRRLYICDAKDLSGSCEQVAGFLCAYARGIEAACRANEQELPTVFVVDGLTFLKERYEGFNRTHIHNLFKTLRELTPKRIWVFTMEARADESEAMRQFENEVIYEADAVYLLRRQYFNGYYLTDLEIQKSRFVESVHGRHAYKIRARSKRKLEMGCLAQKFLAVYPSSHYTMTAYDKQAALTGALVSARRQSSLLGAESFDHILAQSLTSDQYSGTTTGLTRPNPQVISVVGESGLYKSDIVMNALLAGLLEGENGLVVRIGDTQNFERSGVRMNDEVLRLFKEAGLLSHGNGGYETSDTLHVIEEEPDREALGNIVTEKCQIRKWVLAKRLGTEICPVATFQKTLGGKTLQRFLAVAGPGGGQKTGKPDYYKNLSDGLQKEWDSQLETGWEPVGKSGGDTAPRKIALYEMSFQRGALLQEEALRWIFRVANESNIQRIALGNLASLANYPFLIESMTSGNMFLSALVNHARVYGKDLIMTATTGWMGMRDSEAEIQRSLNLSDAVVRCQRDAAGAITVSASYSDINRQTYVIELCDKHAPTASLVLKPLTRPTAHHFMPIYKISRR